MITAIIAFFIGALWVSVISNIGIAGFVDTLGAFLAPLYGILVADYYLVRKQRIDVDALFSADPNGPYFYWQRLERKGDRRLRDGRSVLGRNGLGAGVGTTLRAMAG